MIKNILVCLDRTEFSESILPIATEIAERFSSKILLLSVFVEPTVLFGRGETIIESEPRSEVSEQEAEMGDYLERIAGPLREKGLEVECTTVRGTIEESIITCAKTYEISLIALATHDRSAFSRLVFRSTTDYVLRKSGIPILAICPQKSEKADT